jgi:hypothetical protein
MRWRACIEEEQGVRVKGKRDFIYGGYVPVNWSEVQTALAPIKDYEDLCRRFRESFAYPAIKETFNFTMEELAAYTQQLLGGDARGRYNEYASSLVRLFNQFHQAGAKDIADLVEKTATRSKLEAFVEQSGLQAAEIVTVKKYLVYWIVPMEKYLSGLVRDDPVLIEALKALRDLGIRTNLQLLQKGLTVGDRQALADYSGVPEGVISTLVNIADLSRLPWASKATIANLVGAGYGSIARLANADPEQLYAAFFNYGKSIGKNLKFGNEIESSYRIAKIVPVLVCW